MTHVDEKSELPEGTLQLPKALQENKLPMYQIVGKDGQYFVYSLWAQSLKQPTILFEHHHSESSLEQAAGHNVPIIPGDLLDQLFNLDWISTQAQELKTKGGRGQTLLFNLPLQSLGLSSDPAESGHYCYRKYLRGGLIGKLISKKFFRFGSQSRRAHDEFVMLLQMRALGLPVPQPLVAQEKLGWLTVENAIIIEQVPNTQNLAEIMSQRALSEQEVSKIGTTLAQFFKYNIYHTDLNLRNILLDNQGRCFVIDFDKCYFESNAYRSTVLITLMLKRLERSFIKAQNLGHIHNFNPEIMRILRKSVFSSMLKSDHK